MKKIKNILLFVVSLVLSCCTKEPPHIVEGNRVMHKFSAKLKQNGLRPFGVGGYFFDKVNKYTVSYILFIETMNIEDARKLILETSEEIFDIINKDEKIRPYLLNYPFNPYDNIYLSIAFLDKGQRLLAPNISHVCLFDGKISYSYYENNQFVDHYKESFNDAYFIQYGKEPN